MSERDELDLLTPRQRQVVRLRLERHLGYAAIAERLGISGDTVRDHWKRAELKLRKAASSS